MDLASFETILIPVAAMLGIAVSSLPFLLVFVAVLSAPLSLLLLYAHRRRVRQLMLVSTAPRIQPALQAPLLTDAEAPLVDLSIAPNAATASLADARRLTVAPRRAIVRHVVAGTLYAATLAGGSLLLNGPQTGLEVSFVTFLALFLSFAWPLVVVISLVACATAGQKVIVISAYITLLAAVAGFYPTVVVYWTVLNVPAGIVSLAALIRPIRAIGPLVVAFLLALLNGGFIVFIFAMAGTQASEPFRVALVVGMLLVGMVLVPVLAWRLLRRIRARYEAKKLSDESLTVSTLWLLMAYGHFMGAMLFGVDRTGLATFAALLVYARARVLLRPRLDTAVSKRLLLLRSFSIGGKAQRLFDALEKHWRRFGSIEMIAGYDLATRTVEPHEFLDFLTCKLASRFIATEAALEQRLREMDLRPDGDGRFRVNEFLCHDDMWRSAFARLALESDVVLMDLRGFSASNAGCMFEIHELIAHVDPGRVLFVTDRTTDEVLLKRTLAAGAASSWGRDASAERRPARIFRMNALRWSSFVRLLSALADSAVASRTAAASGEAVERAAAALT